MKYEPIEAKKNVVTLTTFILYGQLPAATHVTIKLIVKNVFDSKYVCEPQGHIYLYFKPKVVCVE